MVMFRYITRIYFSGINVVLRASENDLSIVHIDN